MSYDYTKYKEIHSELAVQLKMDFFTLWSKLHDKEPIQLDEFSSINDANEDNPFKDIFTKSLNDSITTTNNYLQNKKCDMAIVKGYFTGFKTIDQIHKDWGNFQHCILFGKWNDEDYDSIKKKRTRFNTVNERKYMSNSFSGKLIKQCLNSNRLLNHYFFCINNNINKGDDNKHCLCHNGFDDCWYIQNIDFRKLDVSKYPNMWDDHAYMMRIMKEGNRIIGSMVLVLKFNSLSLKCKSTGCDDDLYYKTIDDLNSDIITNCDNGAYIKQFNKDNQEYITHIKNASYIFSETCIVPMIKALNETVRRNNAQISITRAYGERFTELVENTLPLGSLKCDSILEQYCNLAKHNLCNELSLAHKTFYDINKSVLHDTIPVQYNKKKLDHNTVSHMESMLQWVPGYRDHFIHSIKVFLIGYVIIKRIQNSKNKVYEVDDITQLERGWILTSMRHDLSIPIENVEEAIKQYYRFFVKESDVSIDAQQLMSSAMLQEEMIIALMHYIHTAKFNDQTSNYYIKKKNSYCVNDIVKYNNVGFLGNSALPHLIREADHGIASAVKLFIEWWGKWDRKELWTTAHELMLYTIKNDNSIIGKISKFDKIYEMYKKIGNDDNFKEILGWIMCCDNTQEVLGKIDKKSKNGISITERDVIDVRRQFSRYFRKEVKEMLLVVEAIWSHNIINKLLAEEIKKEKGSSGYCRARYNMLKKSLNKKLVDLFHENVFSYLLFVCDISQDWGRTANYKKNSEIRPTGEISNIEIRGNCVEITMVYEWETWMYRDESDNENCRESMEHRDACAHHAKTINGTYCNLAKGIGDVKCEGYKNCEQVRRIKDYWERVQQMIKTTRKEGIKYYTKIKIMIADNEALEYDLSI